MTGWQRALLAPAIVVASGITVGVLTGSPSDESGKVVTRIVTRPEPQAGPPNTATDPAGIAITPPSARDAPDTLDELNDKGLTDDLYVDFGIITIADKTYEGMSTVVDRDGVAGDPQFEIKTNGRYKRMKGVVGIRDDAECTENDARVSITNGAGDTLWGPEHVRLNVPKGFDISIRNRSRVTLDGLSLAPSDNPCNGEANVAWGDVKFVK